ncbi:hypothetical protein JST97_24340 [bacterium]|nr:hypothetical protein [bacterium]
MKSRLLSEISILWLATQVANGLISPTAPGWPAVQPHPYVIPVALVGCRYGIRAGLILALVFGLEYAALSHGANPWLFPQAGIYASLLLTAVVTGWLFDSARTRQQQLERELRQSRLELDESKSQREVLEKAVGELRQRILGQSETFGSLYELARRLTTLQPDQLYAASLELACQRSGACRGFFYGPGFQERAQYPAGSRPLMAAGASQLVRQALEQGRMLTAPELEAPLAAEEPMVALPLAEGALMVLEDLPFERYHPATLGVLQSIGDWTSRALSQLAIYDQKESRLSQGQSARSRVVEQMAQRLLAEAELPLVEELFLPFDRETVRTFQEARWQGLLRENLLRLLERHPNALPTGLAEFLEEERGWVVLCAREWRAWSNYPQGVLMCEHLQALLQQSRDHWTRLAVLSGLPAKLEAEAEPVEIELEELLLEALGHSDPVRRVAALRTLVRLIGEDRRWAEGGAGRPMDYARECLQDRDELVAEAARQVLRVGQELGRIST